MEQKWGGILFSTPCNQIVKILISFHDILQAFGSVLHCPTFYDRHRWIGGSDGNSHYGKDISKGIVCCSLLLPAMAICNDTIVGGLLGIIVVFIFVQISLHDLRTCSLSFTCPWHPRRKIVQKDTSPYTSWTRQIHNLDMSWTSPLFTF